MALISFIWGLHPTPSPGVLFKPSPCLSFVGGVWVSSSATAVLLSGCGCPWSRPWPMGWLASLDLGLSCHRGPPWAVSDLVTLNESDHDSDLCSQPYLGPASSPPALGWPWLPSWDCPAHLTRYGGAGPLLVRPQPWDPPQILAPCPSGRSWPMWCSDVDLTSPGH